MAETKKRTVTPEVARAKLEDLCARGEHCRFELSQKLYKWGISQPDANRILTALSELRFFDDSRFARSFARDKVAFSGWGKQKIILALRLKRIDMAIIKDALSAIDDELYRSKMLDVLTAKARSLKDGNTYEGRTKLYRYGISRGYESSLVTAAIRSGVLFP